ncbi:GSCFA domain-containing protein [Hansschlegelia sp. KR7-227]|uniref:GSCFA domain-containing protein n=1 Tax=Hansschlegelia sp. KR7-227 TaxID=3400914 RepID=UPI003C0FE927
MLTRTKNPYQGLPESAFWKTGVSNKSMFDISDIWDPKFPIAPKHQVATFGSCFAQHIGRALRARGYRWMITEEPPRGLNDASQRRFNYDVFTCRTGTIYTTTLLRQWISWAAGEQPVPDEAWEVDGRFVDPFRPRIEPGGFESLDELRQSRAVTIAAFRTAIEQSDCFVFTMGLTESWWNARHGFEYPVCPGTVAGEFDPDAHAFRNQGFAEIRQALTQSIQGLRKLNPKIKVILTVSPVPLTATASGRHVLAATMLSKSVLRAVADEVSNRMPNVDYFPSFELVFSPPFRATFFEPNMRDINPHGVDFVMDTFFGAQAAKFGDRVRPPTAASARPPKKTNEDVVCEERLLEAFGAR